MEDTDEADEKQNAPESNNIESDNIESDYIESDYKEYKCGLCCFTPDWLQKFKTSSVALITISFAAFVQGALVNGILHLVISTIERRFNLRSVKSGLVSGGYDIASLLCLIPVTYFGGRPTASKPRWIGVGIIVMGVGAFIFALPHFIAPPIVQSENVDTKICLPNAIRLEHCPEKHETKLSNFLWVFLLGNLFHGAGASPLYTLGIAFIDESVVKKKTGIYMGIYYTGATLGIAMGYIIGGSFLELPENIWPNQTGRRTESSLSSKTWIGAWWIGFLLFGCLSMLAAIPILAIPARLPEWEAARLSKISEAVIGRERTENYGEFRELPSAMYELLRNTSFVLLNFAGCCEGLIISGSGAFMPKIIQSQFHLSPRTTSLVMGVITVPSAILGTLVGGGILRKFDLRFVGILKLCICTTSLSLICASCFFITCSGEKMVGLNMPYYSDRKEIKLEDACNEECGCLRKEFIPVCGANNYTYYSACFAGCHQAHNSTYQDVTLYTDCNCISEQLDDGVQASSQSCKTHCRMLPLFLILMYLSLFFTFVAAMPALTATLRCVKSDQRSLALGMQWMLVRLLGMIPGPMLFGVIIDGTCLFWQAPECSDEEGSCILYDHYMISWSMVLLAYGWKLLEIILFCLSIYFYKRDVTRLSNSSRTS